MFQKVFPCEKLCVVVCASRNSMISESDYNIIQGTRNHYDFVLEMERSRTDKSTQANGSTVVI